MSRPKTRYHREPDGFHVTVGDDCRGFVPKHRPGYCVCCEDKSQWPLCPDCHEIVIMDGGDIPAPTAKAKPVDPRPEHIRARDEAMDQVERNSERAREDFQRDARAFILRYLRENGPTPGEDITLACTGAGIVPHDDRAFGPAYHALARKGLIEKVGNVPRKRGHGTAGGIVWAVGGGG